MPTTLARPAGHCIRCTLSGARDLAAPRPVAPRGAFRAEEGPAIRASASRLTPRPSVGARRLLIGGVASQTHPCRRLAAECAASTCLTLFRFGKWQGNGNSKNATASR